MVASARHGKLTNCNSNDVLVDCNGSVSMVELARTLTPGFILFACMWWCGRLNPESAYKINVNVAKFVAKLDDGSTMDMDEQFFVWWVGGLVPIERVTNDLCERTIWGKIQEPVYYSIEKGSGVKLRLNDNLEFMALFFAPDSKNELHLYVEIIDKQGYKLLGERIAGAATIEHHVAIIVPDEVLPTAISVVPPATSNVDQVIVASNIEKDAAACAPNVEEDATACNLVEWGDDTDVDWAQLKLQPANHEDPGEDLVDEDAVYKMLGWEAEDARAKARAKASKGKKSAASTSTVPPAVMQELQDAAIPVNDAIPDEPLRTWDRDDPDMTEETVYPDMNQMRMAVRQHAIKHEFELGTEKSDKDRYRAYCKAENCPWRIVCKTQHDKSVRVHTFVFSCLSLR